MDADSRGKQNAGQEVVTGRSETRPKPDELFETAGPEGLPRRGQVWRFRLCAADARQHAEQAAVFAVAAKGFCHEPESFYRLR